MTKKLIVVAFGVALLALVGSGAFLINLAGQETKHPTIIMGDPSGKQDPATEFTFNFFDADGKPVDRLVLQNKAENEIILINKGKIVHELRSDLFRMFQFDVEIEGIGEIETVGIRDMDLDPGKQVTLKVTPNLSGKVLDEKGGQVEFELGCFLPGHYKNNMKGTIVVTK
jgi:hypothetical protein